MEILKYQREHEDALISAIAQDPEWIFFTNENAIENYRKRLRESVTYVCYRDSEFGGYVRALLDNGFAIYISEVFVLPELRNMAIGRALIKKVKMDFEHLLVYVLSDEDAYYDKLGFRKAGSVFEIRN